MSETLKVATLDVDDSLRQMLQNQISAMDDVELLSQALNRDNWRQAVHILTPDILVAGLNLRTDFQQTLKLVETIKLGVPSVAVFVCSPSDASEVIMAAMRAGAQEFLSVPINTQDFTRAIRRVHSAKEQARPKNAVTNTTIALFSIKGGLGVTTMAVNLAIGLSEVTGNEPALVDLDLQVGDVASLLDVKPQFSILDACNDDGSIDNSRLQSCMIHHDCGVFILAEPGDPHAALRIGASHIKQILHQLKSMYPFIVVDTPHTFDARTLATFEIADSIVVVVVPNISSIRAAKKSLNAFKDLGYSSEKVKVVVNRVSRKDRVKVDELEEVLEHPVFWSVPNNYKAVVETINSGKPLVGSKRLSDVGKSILQLAQELIRPNDTEGDAGQGQKRTETRQPVTA